MAIVRMVKLEDTLKLTPDDWGRQVNVNPSPMAWAEPFLRYIQPGQTVLELGCAGGGLTQQLKGRLVTGLDFAPAALAAASQWCSGTILADVLGDWGVADGSYDWVISCGLLEHFSPTELRQILSKSALAARVGVISAVPNANCTEYMEWKTRREAENTWEYGDEFPKASLFAQFRRAGLRRIEEFSADRTSFNSTEGYLLYTVGYK